MMKARSLAHMYDQGQAVLKRSGISSSSSMGQLGALGVSAADSHALLQCCHARLQA